jgi:hypothetical protein
LVASTVVTRVLSHYLRALASVAGRVMMSKGLMQEEGGNDPRVGGGQEVVATAKEGAAKEGMERQP